MGLRTSSRFRSNSPFFFRHLDSMKTRKVLGFSLSIIIINAAAIMERADENLLPAVYKEVSVAFGAGPADLGYLTFIRNFVRGVASPFAGLLAMNYDRATVLSIGTFCWAVSTAAVGLSQCFQQVAFWRAVNGFGLAIVIPTLQSFTADSYQDGARGAGFGFLYFVGTLGGIGGGVFATLMAGHEFWGIPGWRCAFVIMATLSCVIGGLVFLFVVDPRKAWRDVRESSDRENFIEKGNSNLRSVWQEALTSTKSVLGVQTFQIIVLQGLFGSLPWTAMVFFTMWFELIGFNHNSAATLMSIFASGVAIGCFLGGALADKISRTYPNSGRVICAQFSGLVGIPFSWFLLKAIPQSVSSYPTYAITLLAMGLTISWSGTAANGPIFAEVVPAKHRTIIYAFDRAFEGSFSSFAAPIVGILAERMYGYDSKSLKLAQGSSAHEALALSRGLFSMMAIPFGLCCLLYTPLHWSYRKDRENARLMTSKEAEMM